MSILDLPIPTRPDYFGADGAPPGIALRLDAFGAWSESRPTIEPRVGVVHTNAASVESTTDAQIRWGNSATDRTKPHYCINGPQPAKVLRSDLRAIANSTSADIEARYGERDSSFWTIAIETADTGYKDDPSISDFLTTSRYGAMPVPHAELVARIIAYESIVHDIPTVIPTMWNSTGWVTHTWPFPFPYFTTVPGKTCPGSKKKASFRTEIMPRAALIHSAWTTPPPDHTEDTMTPRYFRIEGQPIPVWSTTDGLHAFQVQGPTFQANGSPAVVTIPQAEAARYSYVDTLHPAVVGVK